MLVFFIRIFSLYLFILSPLSAEKLSSFSSSQDISKTNEIQEYTLQDLVNIGLETHPTTKQAWWNAKRAQASLGNAKSAYYPKIDFRAFATHGRDFKFINGPTTDYSLLGADFILSLLLYDFGQRDAALEATQAALAAAKWETDSTLQKVIINILQNGYATFHEEELVQSAKLSLEDAEKMLKLASELQKAGLVPITDFYTAQSTYLQAKMELTNHRSHLAIQKAGLIASAGLSPSINFKLAEINIPFEKTVLPTKELIGLAYQQRAEIKVREAKILESLSNQKKIAASYKPNLLLTGKGGEESELKNKVHGFHYNFSVNFEMPIFNGFETTYQNRLAFADTQLSIEKLAELHLEIALEILTNIYTLEAVEEVMDDAKKSHYYSKKAYEGVLEKYEAGAESITELSVAFRQLTQSRRRLSEIKMRWLTANANLAYSVGTLFPYLSKDAPCGK